MRGSGLMAGRGRTPKPQSERRTRAKPLRGEWQPSPGLGWQHGSIPEPVPDGRLVLGKAALAAWSTWFRSWFASHWTPDDLPGLYVVVQLYDQCQRAFDDPYIESTDSKSGGIVFVKRPNPTTELRQMLDNYGISPKGQQDRRWIAPIAATVPVAAPNAAPVGTTGRYGHLRAVGGES